MKYLLLAALTLGFSISAFANGYCDKDINEAVQERAAQDFPGKDLTVVLPDTSQVGGSVEFFKVTVLDGSSVLAVYTVMVDETCHSFVENP